MDKPTDSDHLATLIGCSLTDYSSETIEFAWITFLAPFLPVAEALLRSKSVIEAAVAAGLTPDDTHDALTLMGELKRAGDPHQAWKAAEIIKRHCRDLPTVTAALNAQVAQNQVRKE